MSEDDTALRLAVDAGRSAMRRLQRCVQALEKAHSYANTDYWLGSFYLEFPKYLWVFRARGEAKAASRELAKFRERLEALGRDHRAALDLKIGPGEILIDFIDIGLLDLWARERIARRRRESNIALSRVRRVVRALEGDAGTSSTPGIGEAPRPGVKSKVGGRGW